MNFLWEIYLKRRLILDLARRDYRQQNHGSYLGILWNYLQPILFIGILYIVFTSGFRIGADTDTPFSLYLSAGMICWLFFSSNMTTMSGIVQSYRFLVKKVDFPLFVLPLVTILSASLPHLVLTGLVVILSIYQDWWPSLYLIQVIYYFGCMCALLIGIGWLTSSTRIFVKDVGNIVGVITQFGFWLTPVVWRIESMPDNLQFWLKLNPAYYLVSGYRDSLLGGTWFWERPQESLLFWTFTISILLIGAGVFRKLKPHFAEVL